MDFVIDTTGDAQEQQPLPKKNSLIKKLLEEYKEDLNGGNLPSSSKQKASNKVENSKPLNALNKPRVDKDLVNKVLQKSIVLDPNFERLHSIPAYDVSEKKLKAERKKEREKTKGKNWFGMRATELTEEVKNDLEILQMRSALDPKHFYKKNDLKVLPKFFQVGKVLDSPLDYYNDRLTKKERKKTLVDELMADAEFNKYNKRKYKEIIAEKQKTHYKAWKQAKKLKKKKK